MARGHPGLACIAARGPEKVIQTAAVRAGAQEVVCHLGVGDPADDVQESLEALPRCVPGGFQLRVVTRAVNRDPQHGDAFATLP